VTALCRIFAQDGLRVAPFKAQNMSLNSGVTPDGLEIGRAQMVQAEAAGIPAMVEMNPVLLKPEADDRSQVVVMGRPVQTASAQEYYRAGNRARLWETVTAALDALRRQFDVVVIEGAGSPAEINLRDKDIVNMRVALHAQAPVLLAADIDRGGVFASLVGTMVLLEPEERALVKAFVINKFRGDATLLTPGLEMLRERTGVPTAGVIPYFKDIYIPEEDSLGREARVWHGGRSAGGPEAALDVAVMALPHMANFDDFDPLRRAPLVHVRFVRSAAELGDPDLIILPGTKTTVADLEWLRRTGLAEATVARRRAGTPVIGVCGGYQMLGRRILDPEGVESLQPETHGLGLLPVTTVFEREKATHQAQAILSSGRGLLEGAQGAPVTGYEIHMGRTSRAEDAPALARVVTRSGHETDDEDGASDTEGLTLGTYLHGLFHNEPVRRSVLGFLARRKGLDEASWRLGAGAAGEYDKLADLVRGCLDMGMVYGLIGLPGRGRRG
jgi:adenosylcobyric acid synthase